MSYLRLEVQDQKNGFKEIQSYGPAPYLLVFLRHLG